MIESFKAFIAEQKLFTARQKLLLAVSGGLDSAVLCALCAQCGFSFAIAHCNFQLRGEESERDEKFVKALAEKYRVPVYIKRFDTNTYAAEKKLSVQEAARELRYTWFNALLAQQDNSFHWLLTAHHADDSVETSLMNYFKGTGIRGLRGILPKQGKIIRPLLFAGRQEIYQYAVDHSLAWVEDSSNASDKYTRNYFRHQVIPLIRERFPEAEKNMRMNMARFREAEQLYDQALAIHRKKLLVHKGNEVHIAVLKLKNAVPFNTILYEIIQAYGFSSAQTAAVAALLESESGRYVQSTTHRIIRNRAWLIITPIKQEVSSLIVIDELGTYAFGGGTLKVEYCSGKNGKPSQDAMIATVNASLIKFPLILRPWKSGDYFYPLGMTKKKKLARFFIDQKLSAVEKEKVWVLEMNKKIIWVVGMRIDNRFRLLEGAEEGVRVSFSRD